MTRANRLLRYDWMWRVYWVTESIEAVRVACRDKGWRYSRAEVTRIVLAVEKSLAGKGVDDAP